MKTWLVLLMASSAVLATPAASAQPAGAPPKTLRLAYDFAETGFDLGGSVPAHAGKASVATLMAMLRADADRCAGDAGADDDAIGRAGHDGMLGHVRERSAGGGGIGMNGPARH